MSAMRILGVITFCVACLAMVVSCYYSAIGDRGGARTCLRAAAVAYVYTLLAVLL